MGYVWFVVLAPLVGALYLGLRGRAHTHTEVHRIAIASVGSSFVLSVIALLAYHASGSQPQSVGGFTWIHTGDLHIRFGWLVDPLSLVMMLVVTGVSLLIHVYSVGYMHDDPGYARYFSFLNLFVGSMLTLVLADNFLLLFVGWELVGLCSYLLIGFWFEREAAANAGKKAFVVNRVGDCGFLLGMALLLASTGSLSYGEVFSKAAALSPGVVTAICLLFLVGAVGKSAQLPLYVWLPDAMEGPTPVSALIHAATMVTAGVYLIARASALFVAAPVAMAVVAIVGVLTALFAGTIALAQTDIKRVLAYSTISQLGYMFLGCGVGAFWAALFHLTTHAFFKALLFMGAGSVIHALQGEQDIRRMGGLRKYLPATHRLMFWATLTIAGCPLLSGFFSKDAILYSAWHSELTAAHVGPINLLGALLWGVGILTAFLTAVYMMRLYLLVFHGECRVAPEMVERIRESPSVMLQPMQVLMYLSIFGGLLGIPGLNVMAPFIQKVTAIPHWLAEHTPSLGGEWLAAGVSGVVALAGLAFGEALYGWRTGTLAWLASLPYADRIQELAANQWRVEWAYLRYLVQPFFAAARWTTEVLEPVVIDGIGNGLGGLTGMLGQTLRTFQTGYVRNYVMTFTVGAVAVFLYFLFASVLAAGGGR